MEGGEFFDFMVQDKYTEEELRNHCWEVLYYMNYGFIQNSLIFGALKNEYHKNDFRQNVKLFVKTTVEYRKKYNKLLVKRYREIRNSAN